MPGYRFCRAVQCWRQAGCVRGKVSGRLLGPSRAVRLPTPVRLTPNGRRRSAFSCNTHKYGGDSSVL